MDKTLTDNNKHYIITIPREGGLPPYQVFYDRINKWYYTFNCLSGEWQRTDKAGVGLYLGTQDLLNAYVTVNKVIDQLISDGHFVLDVLGMVPVFGAIPDFINGVWYLLEGDKGNAALSFVSVIPGYGDIVGGAKIAATTFIIIARIPHKAYVRLLKLANGVEVLLDWTKFTEKLRSVRNIYPNISDRVISTLMTNIDGLKDADLLYRLFKDPEKLAKAWDFMRAAGVTGNKLYDPLIIDVVMRQLDDVNFINRIGGEDVYKRIIGQFRGGCVLCKEAADYLKPLGNLTDLLVMMETWTNKFAGIPGFEAAIKAFGYDSPAAQRAALFVFDLASKEGRTITAFEFKYLEEFANRADFVVMENGKRILVEAKSWSSEFINKIPTSELTTQLKRYINNPPFEQWFDASAIKEFTKTDQIIDKLTFVKSKYKELFSNADFWKDDDMKAFFLSKGVSLGTNIASLPLSHPLFDFIKLK